jgi:hypothetical protein
MLEYQLTNSATGQGWDDEEKPEESIDPTGGRLGNGQIAQDLGKEHEKLKQQKGLIADAYDHDETRESITMN